MAKFLPVKPWSQLSPRTQKKWLDRGVTAKAYIAEQRRQARLRESRKAYFEKRRKVVSDTRDLAQYFYDSLKGASTRSPPDLAHIQKRYKELSKAGESPPPRSVLDAYIANPTTLSDEALEYDERWYYYH